LRRGAPGCRGRDTKIAVSCAGVRRHRYRGDPTGLSRTIVRAGRRAMSGGTAHVGRRVIGVLHEAGGARAGRACLKSAFTSAEKKHQ